MIWLEPAWGGVPRRGRRLAEVGVAGVLGEGQGEGDDGICDDGGAAVGVRAAGLPLKTVALSQCVDGIGAGAQGGEESGEEPSRMEARSAAPALRRKAG